MGYDTIMHVGRKGNPRDEIKEDLSAPFPDGSGYPYKKDEAGNYVTTGRLKRWFDIYASIDLCKAYCDPIANLISLSHEKAKERWGFEFIYFYGPDGNLEITEDRYGDHMWPVSIPDTLKALRASDVKYRRYQWAIVLLESMQSDREQLEVIFYGH